MIRFLASSLLALGLIAAVPALAQESGTSEPDYAKPGDGPLVIVAADSSREPITAPVRPSARTTSQPDSSTAPLPPKVPGPAAAETKSPSSANSNNDKVIVIVGEPDPVVEQQPALSDDELLDLFLAPQQEEVILTPEGLPPTTSVPAGPGEVRVEKSKIDKPSAPKAAKDPAVTSSAAAKAPQSKGAKASPPKSGGKAQPAKSAKKAPAPTARPAVKSGVDDLLVKRGDLLYHRWALATINWSRVGASGGTDSASLAPGRRLYPIDRAGLPQVIPAKPSRVFTDAHSTWRSTTVVEITRFP